MWQVEQAQRMSNLPKCQGRLYTLLIMKMNCLVSKVLISSGNIYVTYRASCSYSRQILNLILLQYYSNIRPCISIYYVVSPTALCLFLWGLTFFATVMVHNYHYQKTNHENRQTYNQICILFVFFTKPIIMSYFIPLMPAALSPEHNSGYKLNCPSVTAGAYYQPWLKLGTHYCSQWFIAKTFCLHK